MRTNKKNSGFTLVEILIVVVILGILAAIVIPQFSQASLEARESSLISNLQTIRSQIELYKIQHLEVLPTVANFDTVMTTVTDINGAAWVDLPTSGTAYGPYMRKVPDNPFSNGNTVDGVADDWLYTPNAANGTYTFIADDGGTCPDGVTTHASL
jgi:general secretion pathway protein G